ncbi:S1/P1 nuclease (plasmid) [Rhizobium sp. CB3171]|uniref:S1/P1 nuclease n=1 Tax=Rhizobium sp. CB3171 TaxID=3039157 RepID=UPI0024B18667|nr:S1/P1 nuclease [Rhizobium sp. CB3171]WFU07344.1 S1/P1 nuclease [Rhizobium sp. CB3171]
MRLLSSMLVFFMLLSPAPCFAWGAKGHQAVGAIADANLNSHAKAMVASLIGMSLEQAGPWLDCVKDVKGSKGSLHYVEDPNYGEGCSVFWKPDAEKAIVSFAEKNWDNCSPWSDANPCHDQYHFADVDISASDPTYNLGEPGTNDHDVVQAIDAAIAVLQGKPAPRPFADSMDKREALLMLAHLVGDLHQPLHAGAIYLQEDGHQTRAATGEEGSDPGFTRGGNWMFVGTKKLHSLWDTVSDATITKAKNIPASDIAPTTGQLNEWPATWASETIVIAKKNLEELKIEPESSKHHWPIHAKINSYENDIAGVQARQLAAAGHHFAELLNAVWP